MAEPEAVPLRVTFDPVPCAPGVMAPLIVNVAGAPESDFPEESPQPVLKNRANKEALIPI